MTMLSMDNHIGWESTLFWFDKLEQWIPYLGGGGLKVIGLLAVRLDDFGSA